MHLKMITKKTALSEAIQSKGLTINFVKEKANLTYMRLYALRKGTSEPSIHEANALSEVIGISPSELFPKEK